MKPIRKKELFSLLNRLTDEIGKSRNKASKKNKKLDQGALELDKKTTAASDLGDKEKKLLIVEDNADNRMLIRAYLSKSDYKVEMAVNGLEGVEKIEKNNYDLVLMDIQMPKLDGYQAIRRIRELEKADKINRNKIIALTAYALDSDKEKALQAGFDGHLTKPIKKEKLYKMINEYLD